MDHATTGLPTSRGERRYQVERGAGAVGDGPPHLHLVSAPEAPADVFRSCSVLHCQIRPIYRRSRVARDAPGHGTSGVDFDVPHPTPPEALAEASWEPIVQRWDETDNSPEAIAARRVVMSAAAADAHAARLAAWREQAGEIERTWICAIHGPAAMTLYHGLHNASFRMCSVAGCSYRPDVPSEPVLTEPTGWICREHGDEDLRTLRSTSRVYAACGRGDDFEGRLPAAERLAPAPAVAAVTTATPDRMPVAARPFSEGLAASCLLWLGFLAVPVAISLLGWWPAVGAILNEIANFFYDVLRAFPFWDWKNQL